jgi:hypothetical protein
MSVNRDHDAPVSPFDRIAGFPLLRRCVYSEAASHRREVTTLLMSAHGVESKQAIAGKNALFSMLGIKLSALLNFGKIGDS